MQFQENVPLSHFSNYKIGGPARYFFDAKSATELSEVMREWRGPKKNAPIFVLGGGTNLLIDDKGFDGLVVRPNFTFIEIDGDRIRVGAGVAMADLLGAAAEAGLSGLEWAGGLPGTVGGAIRGNAGAFQGEIKDAVESVESFDSIGRKETVRTNAQCRFGYRASVFKEKKGGEVICAATLALKKGKKRDIRRTTEEKIRYRTERHPIEYPNIGSIFKNVDVKNIPAKTVPRVQAVVKTDPFPVVPAAYLISEAGLKGVSFGGAMISPKHPNFIVNVLHASASDVRHLIALAKLEVKKQFGVQLEEEVELVPRP